MLIKICGLRDPENIRAVEALGVDLMGFIFCPTSPRYVSMMPSHSGIIPDHAACGFENGGKPMRVGVFVDDMAQNIITRVYNFRLDYIQLHGSETATAIDNLRRTIDPDIHPGIKIIKTISVDQEDDISKWRDYKGHADMLLFDTKSTTHGGSGEKFDWSLIGSYDGDIPFLISGGIGPEDAPALCAFHHEMFAGIDINSRFETSPGVKDVSKIATFINYIRSHMPNI